MKFLLFFSCVSAFIVSFGNASAQSSSKKLIIGSWVSKDDRKYEVVFTKTKELEYYDDALTATYNYRITNDSLITINKSDSSVFYYSVENISNRYLSLIYLARGNILIFRRKQNNKYSN